MDPVTLKKELVLTGGLEENALRIFPNENSCKISGRYKGVDFFVEGIPGSFNLVSFYYNSPDLMQAFSKVLQEEPLFRYRTDGRIFIEWNHLVTERRYKVLRKNKKIKDLTLLRKLE